MSLVKANTYQDASGGSNAVFSGVASPVGSMGFRNRIINGDMRIDQRNNGASISNPVGGAYSVDRMQIYGNVASKFTAQRNAGSVTPPAGFTNYLGITSSSAYSVPSTERYAVVHNFEGFNTADFSWGTANAQAATLSFWVRSSLTGTFGAAFRNGTTGSPSYPFTYTISAANTWEFKTVTVAGPTTGSWASDNTCSVQLWFSLGTGTTFSGTAGAWAASDFSSATGTTSVVGTNGATFYITGVQLEAGTVASPFERVDYGRQLIQCQRYYWRGTSANLNFSSYAIGALMSWSIGFPVTMRATPTFNSSLSGITYSGCSSLGWAQPNVNAGRLIVQSTTIATNCSFTWGAGDYIDAAIEL